MKKERADWKPVHHPSGATTIDKTVGKFHASIIKVNDNQYVYNVTERPITTGSFHKRATTSSLGSAKGAATRLLRLHAKKPGQAKRR